MMDKNYWESYYKTRRNPRRVCSLFTEFVLEKYLKVSSANLLELGCGNGRDSLYFAKHGIKVTAIDQAQDEIIYLQNLLKTNAHNADINDTNPTSDITPTDENPRFIYGDFTKLDSFGFNGEFDCIYSRFTLHSIDKTSQDKTLSSALALLKEGGILAIEARGFKNSLYGKGKAVSGEKDAFFYDNHYRRFLDFKETIREIQSLRCKQSDSYSGNHLRNLVDFKSNSNSATNAQDSKNCAITHANSSILDEKSGLRRFEQGNRTDSSLTKRKSSLPDFSLKDEFAMGGGDDETSLPKTFGFTILYSAESRGFAPYNGEDDYFIRIIAQKIKIL